MPRSKPKRASGGGASRGAGRGGGRLQTLGIFVTLAAVALLLGSVAWGVWDHYRGRRAEAAPATREPATAQAPPAAPASAPQGRVRVQVLNATPTHGLARKATDVLRDHGFDVVETGNAPRGTAPGESLVIDRVGRPDVERQVADALGIRRVEARRDANLLLDATVILGRDWREPAAPAGH
jgi:pyruvate/2-oxoglutarate dehydrogenase complex dihydrolipoamide acyltransferase (E2) component